MPILLYHQVSEVRPEQDPYGLASTPAQFAEQMAYLHDNHYTCLRLVDYARAYRDGQPIPPKTFVITFDDGYRDNYEIAWPIMKKYGFTATIFLVADQIGSVTNWEGQKDTQSFPLMNWDEIREMQAGGIDFGSHTCTHPRLNQLSAEAVKQELCDSKTRLAEGLERSVETLAYPYEVSTYEVQRIAAECGYLAACGTANHPESLYNLWRVEFGAEDTLASLKYKLSALQHRMEEFKRQARKVKKWIRG